jgi:hypothetical protein
MNASLNKDVTQRVFAEIACARPRRLADSLGRCISLWRETYLKP